MNRTRTALLAAAIGTAAVVVAAASALSFSPWNPATNAEAVPGTSAELNTSFNDGCPILSPDGLSLYIASNRSPGGLGLNDIWVAHRASVDAPFGAPKHLPEPVNSTADDFCPTPLHGKRLLFVSTRGGPGSCGGADIYLTRKHPVRGWLEPENLGCDVNSSAGEAGPSLVETDEGAQLYFSSTRAGGPGAGADSDLYVSAQLADGSFGAAELVAGLNTASEDSRPNVRKDGLEVVFDSTRPGGLGGPDLYTSARESLQDPWSSPVNLGAVNSTANETRASLSWDGETLFFGSNRANPASPFADVYFTTREHVNGS